MVKNKGSSAKSVIYMDVVVDCVPTFSTLPLSMAVVCRFCMDDSRDAYMDVGGRATQDAKAEGGGSERLEHVLEQKTCGLIHALP